MTAPATPTTDELLEQLGTARRWEASLLAELRERNVEPPLTPECDHPHRRAAAALTPDGLLACYECSAVLNGLDAKDVAYFARQEPDKDEWSDEWKMPRYTPMSGDLR